MSHTFLKSPGIPTSTFRPNISCLYSMYSFVFHLRPQPHAFVPNSVGEAAGHYSQQFSKGEKVTKFCFKGNDWRSFSVCAAGCNPNLGVSPFTWLLCNIQLTEHPCPQSVGDLGLFARSTV